MTQRKIVKPAHSDDSSVTSMLAFSVVILVAGLLLGGYWLQKQRVNQVELSRQAEMHNAYLRHTRPSLQPAAAVELPAAYVQAQQTREKLLNHPAVTPGSGFNQRGVQSTGEAIIDAIDSAKSQHLKNSNS